MNKNLKKILAGVLSVTFLLSSVELSSIVNNKFIAATINDKSLENFMDEVSSLYEEDDLSSMAPDITFSKESEKTVVIDDTIMVPVEVLTENTDISYSDIKEDIVEQDNEELVAIEDVAKNTDYEAIKNDDESITLSKIYQSKTLIVKSPVQIDTYDAENVISGYGNLYILKYATEEDTKNAYDKFLKNKNIDSVEIDSLISTETLESIIEETIEESVEEISETSTEEITEESSEGITGTSETTESSEDTSISEETMETLSETESNEELSSESTEEATTEQEAETINIPDSVIVAILDSGIDVNNTLFDGRIIDLGLNLSTSGEGIQDDNGHGTAVASVIAKNSDAYIMPIKIANSDGKGTVLSLYLAIQAAIENDADIINVSLTTSSSDLLTSITHEATEKGIVVIAAAGNQSANVENYAPANIESVITVAATDKEYNPAFYSNYGELIDYAALGEMEVESLNGPTIMTGTSLSAAYVTSVMAFSIDTGKDFSEFVYSNGENVYYGKGVVSLTNITLPEKETVDIEGFDFRINQSLLIENDRDNYKLQILTNADVEYTFNGGITWQKSSYIKIDRNEEFYDGNEYVTSIRTLGIKDLDGNTNFKDYAVIDCNNPKDPASQEIDLSAAGMTDTTSTTGSGYYNTNADSTTTYNLYNFNYNITDLTAENVSVRVCNTNTSSTQSFSFPSSLYVKYNGTKKTLKVISLGDGSSSCLTDATGGFITKIVIPTSVISINNKAFYSYSYLTTVSFAANSKCTTIGDYAFSGCSALANIRNANANYTCTGTNCSPTSTSEHSVSGCTGTISDRRYRLPVSITTIGDYAFYNCSSLKKLNLNTGVTSVGSYAFDGCTSLCQIHRLPNCTIGTNAFPLWTYQRNTLNASAAPLSHSYALTEWNSDINSSYYYKKYSYCAGSDYNASKSRQFIQDETAHSDNFIANSGMNATNGNVHSEWVGAESSTITSITGNFTYVPAFEGYLSKGTVVSFTLFSGSCQHTVDTYAGLRVASAASGVTTFSSGRFVVDGEATHKYYLNGASSTVYSSAGEYTNFSNPMIWTRGDGSSKLGTCSAYITYNITTTGYYKFEVFGYAEHCMHGPNWVAFSSDTTGITLPSYTHTLNYDANGGTGAPSTQSATNYVDNHIFTISSTKPLRSGYTFLGWSENQNATSPTFKGTGSETIQVAANGSKTLYAIWTANGYTNTLNYNANGGSGAPSAQTASVTYPNTQSTFTVSTTKPTRTGYTFDGWYTAATGGTKVGTTYIVGNTNNAGNQSATLYAHWTANGYTNTLSYNANGGSGAPSAQTASVTYPNTQSTFTVSTTKPTRTGYTFDGWYTAATGGTKVGTTYTVGSNNVASNQSATLYAHWTLNTYTLTVDPNGGTMYYNSGNTTTTSFNIKFKYGSNRHLGTFTGSYYYICDSTVGKPKRAGYTFNGWKVTSGGGTVKYYSTPDAYGYKTDDFSQNMNRPSSVAYYLFDGNYAGDVTITAQWIANNYTNTLSYDANGGSGAPVAQTASVTYPNTQNTFTVSTTKPTRTGYTFDGWYTAATGGTKVGTTYTVGNANNAGNQSATIYAQWKINSYTVTYNGNGSTSGNTANQTFNYGGSVNISSNGFAKTGYTFTGWNTEADGNGVSYQPGQTYSTNNNLTLYAQWKIGKIDIPVTITWVDKNNEYASRPKQVTLRLMNGTEVVKEAKKVTGDNSAPASTNVWTYKFEGVDMYDSNGKEIHYIVVEGGYEKDGTFVADAVSSLVKEVSYKTPVYGGNNSGLTVINALSDEPIEPEDPTKDYGVTISGTVTWKDENDKYHFRPDSVIVELYQDGKLYDSIELKEGTTDYKFTGLPMMDSNYKKYTYTIKEKDIDNYEITYESDSKTTTVEDDFGNTVTTTIYTVDITNTFTPDKETERFSDNQLTMQATFLNENGNPATESDFKKVKLDKEDVNTTIVLKQLNLSWEPVNAEEGKYLETYSGYSGNEINLILHGTDKTYANFIPYGKYEIAVQNDNNFTTKDIEELATKNAEFSYENGKYYVTYSYEYEEAKEDLNVNMTLKSWRGYTSKMGINNFFKNSD